MGHIQTSKVKLITPGVHRLSVLISLLALIMGLLLFLFPYHTDAFFAWTVLPPLTAACLGGVYLAALVVARMASRESIWSNTRAVFPGMLLVTALTLIATLLHLDKFHFTHADLLARLMAWVWVIFHAVSPITLLALIIFQLRRPGSDLPPQELPPTGYRRVLFGEGLIMLLIGLTLFLSPMSANFFWPWKLNLLTAQILGAWLIGIGFALCHSAFENAWERIRTALWGNIALGVLQLVSVARFASTLEWNSPASWIYTAFCLGMIVIGGVGWIEMWSKTTSIG